MSINGLEWRCLMIWPFILEERRAVDIIMTARSDSIWVRNMICISFNCLCTFDTPRYAFQINLQYPRTPYSKTPTPRFPITTSSSRSLFSPSLVPIPLTITSVLVTPLGKIYITFPPYPSSSFPFPISMAPPCPKISYPTTNAHLPHLDNNLFSNPSSLPTTMIFLSCTKPTNNVYPSLGRSCCCVAPLRPSSAPSSSRPGDKERVGGADGKGRMIALSRDEAWRRGSAESVCVEARRRELHMQW